MGWRVAVLAALALLSCATVPQAQVFQLPGGVTMTITQGCPIDLDLKKLKREDSVEFAIDETSVPSPGILHGAVAPTSYAIIMEAGSYEPNVSFSCKKDSRHSLIIIEGMNQSLISIRPVNNWAKFAGPQANEGYAKNVQACKENGPRWSGIWTDGYLARIAGTDQMGSVDHGFIGCNGHVGQMSNALTLTVGSSQFVISKIVDDFFIEEVN
jgi:hypothetical protein